MTRFCFQLHPADPEVMFCAPVYPASARIGATLLWRDFIAPHTDDLWSLVEFATIPESPDCDSAFRGQRCYFIAADYAGDAGTGERLVEPLRHLGPKAADVSGTMHDATMQTLFDAPFPTGAFRCYGNNHLMAVLTDEMIADALHNAIDNTLERSRSSIWSFGGAMASVPAEATAFGAQGLGWMHSLDLV
ncbi:MAG TPA: hypothetical protein PKA03_10195 [Tabrizicola sp.]|nr:hypothetical protein [Tabrizicola sp.]